MKGSSIELSNQVIQSKKIEDWFIFFISTYPISSQSLKIHLFCDYNTIHLMEIYVIYFTLIFLKD